MARTKKPAKTATLTPQWSPPQRKQKQQPPPPPKSLRICFICSNQTDQPNFLAPELAAFMWSEILELSTQSGKNDDLQKTQRTSFDYVCYCTECYDRILRIKTMLEKIKELESNVYEEKTKVDELLKKSCDAAATENNMESNGNGEARPGKPGMLQVLRSEILSELKSRQKAQVNKSILERVKKQLIGSWSDFEIKFLRDVSIPRLSPSALSSPAKSEKSVADSTPKKSASSAEALGSGTINNKKIQFEDKETQTSDQLSFPVTTVLEQDLNFSSNSKSILPKLVLPATQIRQVPASDDSDKGNDDFESYETFFYGDPCKDQTQTKNQKPAAAGRAEDVQKLQTLEKTPNLLELTPNSAEHVSIPNTGVSVKNFTTESNDDEFGDRDRLHQLTVTAVTDTKTSPKIPTTRKRGSDTGTGTLRRAKVPKLNSQIYRCNVCDGTFDFNASLRMHLLAAHTKRSRPTDKKFTCKTCSRRFSKFSSLEKHLEKNMNCDLCSENFCANEKFQVHLENHKGYPIPADPTNFDEWCSSQLGLAGAEAE